MDFQIVKLNFTSPLHLAKGAIDYSEGQQKLHSDTLKSALFAAARMLYGDALTEKQSESENPFFTAFSVSSAFPFYGEELFFPRPQGSRLFEEEDEKTKVKPKTAKKVRYLGQSLFEKYLNGAALKIGENQIWHGGEFASEKNFGSREEVIFYKRDDYQHVTIPRDGASDSEPFYMERLYFPENAGLFFLIVVHDVAWEPQIRAALEILGDEGIGSDRSTGNGQFKTDGLQPFSHDFLSEPTESCLNLSLFCPNREEFGVGDWVEKSAYRLIRRGGYIASPSDHINASLRKKPVYFFEEGSVFPKPANFFKGKLLNVRPGAMIGGHPVFREGRSIFLPVHKNAAPQMNA